MGQLTLTLPETLHRQLESSAKHEGVQLDQYILYILSRQTNLIYSIQVMTDEDITQQETNYAAFRQRWDTASAEEIKSFLADREVIEPEPDLPSEIILKLKQRIAAQQEADD